MQSSWQKSLLPSLMMCWKQQLPACIHWTSLCLSRSDAISQSVQQVSLLRLLELALKMNWHHCSGNLQLTCLAQNRLKMMKVPFAPLTTRSCMILWRNLRLLLRLLLPMMSWSHCSSNPKSHSRWEVWNLEIHSQSSIIINPFFIRSTWYLDTSFGLVTGNDNGDHYIITYHDSAHSDISLFFAYVTHCPQRWGKRIQHVINCK